MDDRVFLSAFEAAAISSDRWTHRDHVRVAFLYLRALPFSEAVDRLRRGIRALNRANGVADTPTSGYHETVTVAWARIVAAAITSELQAASFETFANACPTLLSRDRLRAHYGKERLMSSAARASFVEPDLEPLPGRDP
jgi:hypothetical protein